MMWLKKSISKNDSEGVEDGGENHDGSESDSETGSSGWNVEVLIGMRTSDVESVVWQSVRDQNEMVWTYTEEK